jgi:hypothetical protein
MGNSRHSSRLTAQGDDRITDAQISHPPVSMLENDALRRHDERTISYTASLTDFIFTRFISGVPLRDKCVARSSKPICDFTNDLIH